VIVSYAIRQYYCTSLIGLIPVTAKAKGRERAGREISSSGWDAIPEHQCCRSIERGCGLRIPAFGQRSAEDENEIARLDTHIGHDLADDAFANITSLARAIGDQRSEIVENTARINFPLRLI